MRSAPCSLLRWANQRRLPHRDFCWIGLQTLLTGPRHLRFKSYAEHGVHHTKVRHFGALKPAFSCVAPTCLSPASSDWWRGGSLKPTPGNQSPASSSNCDILVWSASDIFLRFITVRLCSPRSMPPT